MSPGVFRASVGPLLPMNGFILVATALVVPGCLAASVDPSYAQNLTLYHLNEANYSGIGTSQGAPPPLTLPLPPPERMRSTDFGPRVPLQTI